MKSQRPIIDIEWETLDYVLEAIAFAGAVSGLLVAISNYGSLPGTIPIHFDLQGRPDSWGSKQYIWLLPSVGLILYAGLTLLNRYPHKYNFPAEITEENAAAQYSMATRLVRFLNAFICAAFAFITWQTIQIAGSKTEALPAWLTWVFIAGVLLAPIWYVYRASKHKRS